MKQRNHVVKRVKALVSRLFMDKTLTVTESAELKATNLYRGLVIVDLQPGH